jgi:hypothetical protein
VDICWRVMQRLGSRRRYGTVMRQSCTLPAYAVLSTVFPCSSFSLFRFYECIGNDASARNCIFSGNELIDPSDAAMLLAQIECARILFCRERSRGRKQVQLSILPLMGIDSMQTQTSITMITFHHCSRRVR